jgi:hypothetical protein
MGTSGCEIEIDLVVEDDRGGLRDYILIEIQVGCSTWIRGFQEMGNILREVHAVTRDGVPDLERPSIGLIVVAGPEHVVLALEEDYGGSLRRTRVECPRGPFQDGSHGICGPTDQVSRNQSIDLDIVVEIVIGRGVHPILTPHFDDMRVIPLGRAQSQLGGVVSRDDQRV